MVKMRSAVSSLLVLLLLSILTLCPLMACAHSASDQCCDRSSCPKTSAPECSYLLLEKSKSATPVSHLASLALNPVAPILDVSAPQTFIAAESRLPSSHGLYLRIRVLLI
jgi:hypothetical protein